MAKGGTTTTATTVPPSAGGYHPGQTTSGPGNGFPNQTTGSASAATDKNLGGLTQAQASQKLTVTNPSTGQQETVTVAQFLQQFYSIAPDAQVALGQELYQAGLMSDSVYNAGQFTTTDIFNALKNATTQAAQSGENFDTYMANKTAEENAIGGPKIKLPQYKHLTPLTSYDDVSQAADDVFQRLLGRRATDAEKAALTKALNTSEISAGKQIAQGEYSQLLAFRGLSPTGTPLNQGQFVGPTGTMGDTSGATVGGWSARTGGTATGTQPQTIAGANPGADIGGNNTTVQNASGATSTVTGGPFTVNYAAAPSASALAYQTALQNNPAEVKGRDMANALQAIVAFMSKPQGQG